MLCSCCSVLWGTDLYDESAVNGLQVNRRVQDLDRLLKNSLCSFYSKTNQMHQCIKFILFWKWDCTCFGRSFRPSSGVQDCRYSNRHLSNRYCCLLASGYEMELQFHLVPQYLFDKCLLLYHVCTVLNSWWWTERPSDTCRVSFPK